MARSVAVWALAVVGLGLGAFAAPQPPGLSAPAPATASAAQAPAASQPSFPAAIDQVVVDVVVTDQDGRPVTGLGASDFLLSEDGVAQTIASFEAFTARDVPEPEITDVPVRVSTNPATPIGFTGRTFAIVFDDDRLTVAQAMAARRAVEDFLNHRVREGDRVLLAATSGQVFWGTRLEEGREELLRQLDRLQGRHVIPIGTDVVTDGEAFQIVVRRNGETFAHVVRRFMRGANFNPRPTSPGDAVMPVTGYMEGNECGVNLSLNPEPCMVANEAKATYLRAVGRLRDSLVFLEHVLRALEGVHGRKSVVLISPGFYQDPDVDEFRDVEDASRRANAPVSFLNASGLPGMPEEMSAVMGGVPVPADLSVALAAQREESAGAEVVAEATGGAIVRNRNDLARGLRSIVDEESAYYLLGFTSTNEARDGRYRRLQVRLAPAPAGAPGHGGWEVRARKGYYAPGPRSAAAPDASEEARATLLAPFDRAGVPLRLTAQVLEEKTPGKARCRLVGEVDVRALELGEKDGVPTATLEVLFATATPSDGKWTPRGRRLEMKLPSGVRERLEREWYVVTDEVELPAGAYVARLVVRDATSGRMGSVTHRLDVPELDRIRLATPVVADLLQPTPEGELPWPAPIARRQFAAGDRLHVGVQVFRPRGTAAGDPPPVTARAEIVRPDGEPLTAVEARPMDLAPDGSLRRLLRLSLGGAVPGEHQLVVEAVDDTGRTLVWTESLTVVPPTR
jgi:VWFA-related protein